MYVRRALAAVAAVLIVGTASVGAASGAIAAPAPTVTKYSNCAKLNLVYRHGVGRKGAVDQVRGSTKPVRNFTVNTSVYKANIGRDRDGDGIACEKA